MIDALFTRIAGKPELEHEAPNGLRHVAALTMTKLADGLIDPKLVLAWLFTALAVPTGFISALVPIREAGALLPQLWLATRLEAMTQRKWMWVVGSVGQGIAAAAIAFAALRLEGAAAGWVIVVALAVLAVSRAAASVSYKELLGKSVGESRRGAVTGMAGSLSAAGVVVFALLLVGGVLKGQVALAGAVALAAALWLVSALIFVTLQESPSKPDRSGRIGAVLLLLRDDKRLARFVVARGFLVATALSPPYIVLIAGEGENSIGDLGFLVIASSAAAFLSTYAWGRMADRSSRRVLILSGLLGAAAMVGAVTLSWLGLAESVWAMPAALFLLMIAHHGVRQGRSIFIVDMAPEGRRGSYAAAANTVIGVLLLVAGAGGGLLSMLGPEATLIGFAGLAVTGAAIAAGLPEVGGG